MPKMSTEIARGAAELRAQGEEIPCTVTVEGEEVAVRFVGTASGGVMLVRVEDGERSNPVNFARVEIAEDLAERCLEAARKRSALVEEARNFPLRLSGGGRHTFYNRRQSAA